MSIFDPVDTLAYHSSWVGCQHRDMSGVACIRVASSVSKYLSAHSASYCNPERGALWFYMLNHCKAVLTQAYHPLEPLTPADRSTLNGYMGMLNEEAIRAFYYLLLICIRESRHVNSTSHLRADLAQQFGESCADFNLAIGNTGSVVAYQRFLQQPPNVAIGPFCKSLRHIFYHGQFGGGGFGGPAWGAIADCLCRFVAGEYTAEM